MQLENVLNILEKSGLELRSSKSDLGIFHFSIRVEKALNYSWFKNSFHIFHPEWNIGEIIFIFDFNDFTLESFPISLPSVADRYDFFHIFKNEIRELNLNNLLDG